MTIWMGRVFVKAMWARSTAARLLLGESETKSFGGWRGTVVVALVVSLALFAPSLLVQPSAGGVSQLAATFCILGLLLLLLRWTSRLDRRISTMEREMVAQWSLSGLTSPERRLLPRLTGYALNADGACALLEHASRLQPRNVVELGPGASTVLLDLLFTSMGLATRIYTFEHDEVFAENFRRAMGYYGIERCTIVESQLVPMELEGWRGHWYATHPLSELPQTIELLVVDGPPGHVGHQSRYPAFPVFRSRLAEGSLIFLDDTDRQAEATIVRRWVDSGELEIIERGSSFTVLRRTHVQGDEAGRTTFRSGG